MRTDIFFVVGNAIQRLLNRIKNSIPIRIKVQRLHLFTDDVDTFVAFDANDAEKCYFEHVGESRENCTGDDNLEPYFQIKDNSPIKIWFEDEDDIRESKPLFSDVSHDGHHPTLTAPAWAWALKKGRGFLCSTEC